MNYLTARIHKDKRYRTNPNLIVFYLPQPAGEAGRVALLVQVHLHELFDGQLTAGRGVKLRQSNTGRHV